MLEDSDKKGNQHLETYLITYPSLFRNSGIIWTRVFIAENMIYCGMERNIDYEIFALDIEVVCILGLGLYILLFSWDSVQFSFPANLKIKNVLYSQKKFR